MDTSAPRRLSWATALRLGRVSNLPTVWTNTAAGMILADAPPSSRTALALGAALSLFYVAGMYLNDAFDAPFDRLHRPERPIPQGLVTREWVFAVGGALVAGALALLLLVGGWRGFCGGCALAVAIVVYDARHKGNPFGPVLMGMCRFLTYVTAAVVSVGHLPGPVLVAACVALSYLIGLTTAAKQERLTDPREMWPFAFLAAPIVYGVPFAIERPIAALLLALLLAAVGSALWLLVRTDGTATSRAVAMLIAAICLLDGLFIAGHGQALLALATIAAFALTLALQRLVAGT